MTDPDTQAGRPSGDSARQLIERDLRVAAGRLGEGLFSTSSGDRDADRVGRWLADNGLGYGRLRQVGG